MNVQMSKIIYEVNVAIDSFKERVFCQSLLSPLVYSYSLPFYFKSGGLQYAAGGNYSRLHNLPFAANQVQAKETDLSHPQTRSSPSPASIALPHPNRIPCSDKPPSPWLKEIPSMSTHPPRPDQSRVPAHPGTWTNVSLSRQVQPEAPRGHHADARPHSQGRGDWNHVCFPRQRFLRHRRPLPGFQR